VKKRLISRIAFCAITNPPFFPYPTGNNSFIGDKLLIVYLECPAPPLGHSQLWIFKYSTIGSIQ